MRLHADSTRSHAMEARAARLGGRGRDVVDLDAVGQRGGGVEVVEVGEGRAGHHQLVGLGANRAEGKEVALK